MPNRIQEIEKICRFCLSQQRLMPLSKATCSTIAIEDVVRCTGIRMSEQEKLFYAICNDCYRTISNSVNFRRTCLKNDNVFNTLVSVLNASVTTNAEESETTGLNPFSEFDPTASSNEIIELDDTESDDSMYSLNGHCLQQVSPRKLNPEENAHEQCSTKDTEKRQSKNIIYEDTDYEVAASSVKEDSLSTDDCDSDYSMPSLYEEAMKARFTKQQSTNNVSENNKTSSSTQQYTKEQSSVRDLCHICGICVGYMPRHLERVHEKQLKWSCPHCPVKVLDKYSLKKHINTWHEKRIIFTCQHCGRGFVNRTSLGYHLANSHGKSDVYVCKICDRKLKSYDGYKKHLKEHSVTAITCHECGRIYKTNATFAMHQLRYHPSST